VVVEDEPGEGFRVIGWCKSAPGRVLAAGDVVVCYPPRDTADLFTPLLVDEPLVSAAFPVVIGGAPHLAAILVPRDDDPRLAWLPDFRPLASVLR
jgi:hypothetical protein